MTLQNFESMTLSPLQAQAQASSSGQGAAFASASASSKPISDCLGSQSIAQANAAVGHPAFPSHVLGSRSECRVLPATWCLIDLLMIKMLRLSLECRPDPLLGGA